MNTQTLPRFSARKKNKDLMSLLISTDSFKKEVKAFRAKFNIAENGNNADGAQEKWVVHMLPRRVEYFAELNELIRSYHRLPQHFDRHVRDYIEQGVISWPINNFDVIPAGYPDPVSRPMVYAKLPQKEQEDFFAELNRTGEGLPSVGTIKDLDGLIESERIYKDCEEYNHSKHRRRPVATRMFPA